MSDNPLKEKYLSPSEENALLEDTTMVSPPRTPTYRREHEVDDDDLNHFPADPFSDTEEASPPSSQLEERHKITERANQRRTEPPKYKRSPFKPPLDPPQSRKRNYKNMSSGNQTLDYKISKTQESVQKLDKHLKLKTCPRSLHYTARANIAPDEIYQTKG